MSVDRVRHLWPWLPLWTVLALLAIFSHGPIPLYSTRTLAVAWEMWNSGYWLVPHLNGVPYPDKVPLLYWLMHAGWAVFGVSDVWPRLLQVLLGVAQLLLARRLAERLFPTRRALVDASSWLLIAFSYAFLFGLQIMYETLLAVWVLAALSCLVGNSKRNAPHFGWLGLFLGLGLLSKGPVMLLHVLPVWLLGPWWSAWARDQRRHWYGGGALALLGGVMLFAAWLVPAAMFGGAAYRHELLYTQTAGRVAEAFIHAQPWWWYGPRLLLLLLPFAAWPRFWVSLFSLPRPLESGVRFALCWLVPVLVAFSLISGKQTYYLIPEMAALALLAAAALDHLRQRGSILWQHPALGPWPLAVVAFALAVALTCVPWWTARLHAANEWLVDLAPYAPWFAPVFVVLGVVMLLRGSAELRRIAVAGLVGVFALHALFTLALWPRYDLGPAARVLAQAAAQGRAIVIIGQYQGQYHFLARLKRPITRIHDYSLPDWAHAHPDGIVITDPPKLPANARQRALLVQPFRSRHIVLWGAAELVAAQQAGSRGNH